MIVKVQSLSKAYFGKKAVDDVSFTVQPGQIVGLLGPNGAGKTTTMNMITGILAPDSGHVLFDDVLLSANELEIKKKIGYLSEVNPLYSEMLVGEYLDYMAGLRGIEPKDRQQAIDSVMNETGISQKKFQPIEELSKGYKQRVGLAQAILHKPEILILDEPTEGLDPNQRVTIRQLIEQLGKDRTVLISTHVLSEVQAMCDQVVILNQGKLISQGTVDDIIAAGQQAQSIFLDVVGSDVVAKLSTHEAMTVASCAQKDGHDLLTLVSKQSVDLRPIIYNLIKQENWVLYEMYQESTSLEDIFRNLTIGSATVKIN